jgi:hypothetical protein
MREWPPVHSLVRYARWDGEVIVGMRNRFLVKWGFCPAARRKPD